jgi:hypothetical protein
VYSFVQRFSCMAEFIRRPPKTVNRTKDPYDLDKSVQQGAATPVLLAVSSASCGIAG